MESDLPSELCTLTTLLALTGSWQKPLSGRLSAVRLSATLRLSSLTYVPSRIGESQIIQNLVLGLVFETELVLRIFHSLDRWGRFPARPNPAPHHIRRCCSGVRFLLPLLFPTATKNHAASHCDDNAGSSELGS